MIKKHRQKLAFALSVLMCTAAMNPTLSECIKTISVFAEESRAEECFSAADINNDGSVDDEDLKLVKGAVNSKVGKISLVKNDTVEFEGHHYKIYNLNSDWNVSKAYCESLGGHLATITSQEENDFLYEYLTSTGNQNAYFGLSDAENEGEWKWVTGEEFVYSNWGSGEPNSGTVENYGMFYQEYTNGEWNDGGEATSSARLSATPFICEWDEFVDDKEVIYDVFKDNVIDIRDVVAVQNVIDSKSFPEADEVEEFYETLDLEVENVDCDPGDRVKVDLNLVDWQQDISGIEIVLNYSSELTFLNDLYTSDLYDIVCEDNTLKISGLYADKELYRGLLSQFYFMVPEKLGFDYSVWISSVTVCNENMQLYKLNNVRNGLLSVSNEAKPRNFSITSLNSKSVNIGWNMPYEKELVDEYVIYRDDEEIARTAQTTYSDTGLETGKTYNYVVQASGEDYLSGKSKTLTVVPRTPEITLVQMENGKTEVGGNGILISANVKNPFNVKSAVFYYTDSKNERHEISEATSTNKTEFLAQWQFRDENGKALLKDGEYNLFFEATDTDGGVSAESCVVNIITSLPDPVEEFSVDDGEEKNILSWFESPQLRCVGYNIYRVNNEGVYALLTSIKDKSTVSYTDKDVEVGKKYAYVITAVDKYGMESLYSAEAGAAAREDETAPVITLFNPLNNSIFSKSLNIEINATDEIGIKLVECYLSDDEGENWKLIASAPSSVLRYTLDLSDYEIADISLKAVAYDIAGNETTAPIRVCSIDNKGPEKVADLRVIECSATTATLKWNDVADDDRSYFIVERIIDGEISKEKYTVSSVDGINLSTLTPYTEYTYQVTAYDNLGNRGISSDPVVFTTVNDETAPKIIAIKPRTTGAYSASIPLEVIAEDNYQIKSLTIQVSTDMKNWTDVKSETFENPYSPASISIVLDIKAYEEGMLYVRGVAEDTAGNVTDVNADNALVYRYTIDHTPPAAVTDITAKPSTRNIEIIWAVSNDTASVNLYRAEGEGEYKLIAGALAKLNYLDTAVKSGIEYKYSVQAFDAAGNASELSEPVTVQLVSDEEAPVIESIAPGKDVMISEANKQISVLASDDYMLSSVIIEYRTNETDEWTLLARQDNINNYYVRIAKTLPDSVLKADVLFIRVKAIDVSGKESEYLLIQYQINNMATEITDASVKLDADNCPVVTWRVKDESSAYCYNVYRVSQTSRVCVARMYPSGGSYSFTDTTEGLDGEYWYEIEAVNKSGRTKSATTEKITIHSAPEAIITCDNAMKTNYEFEAWFDISDKGGVSTAVLDFGDGTIKNYASENQSKMVSDFFIHKYAANGTYTIKLTAKNIYGLVTTVEKTVLVEDQQKLGKVEVQVVTFDGKPATGIYVYLDLGESSQTRYKTNNAGKVSFTASVGEHAIGVYGDGYLPAAKYYNVMSVQDNKVYFEVEQEDIITASFDVTRMTLDEIRAAGIDTSDPANQYITEIKIQLEYELVVHAKPGQTSGFGGGSGYGFWFWCAPQIKGGKGSGGSTPDPEPDPDPAPEIDTLILMEVPVKASFLKEFFDVKLHIINNADEEFTVSNNIVSLNVPNGLTLMDTSVSSPATVMFDSIAGQHTETVRWILRGDKKGTYALTANYFGTLDRFNAPIEAVFSTDPNNGIVVNGTDGISMVITFENMVEGNETCFEVAIKNNSSIDINNLNIDIGTIMTRIFGSFKSPSCSPIRARLTNSDGVTSFVTPKEQIDTLQSGHTYGLIYRISSAFVNNVINPETDKPVNLYEDSLRLVGLYISEVTQKDFAVSLATCDSLFNRFDNSFAIEKVKRLSNETKDDYDYITNGDMTYNQLADWLRANSATLLKGEFNDDCFDFLLNFGFDDITDKDKKEYIESIIFELLQSNSIDEQIALAYANNILDTLRSFLTEFARNKGIVDNMKKILDDPAIMNDIVNNFANGKDISNIISNNLSSLTSEQKTEIMNSFSPDLSTTFKKITFGLNIANAYLDEAQNAYQRYNAILMLKATKDESVALLNSFAAIPKTSELNRYIVEAANDMLEDMEKKGIEFAAQALRDGSISAGKVVITCSLASGAVKVISAAAGTAAPVVAILYTLAKVAYNEWLGKDIDMKYLVAARIMVLDSMSDAINVSLNDKYNGGNTTVSDEEILKFIEYISKINEMGESSAIDFYNFVKYGNKAALLSQINVYMLYVATANNMDMDVIEQEINKNQESRNNIFAPPTTGLSAPSATFDYQKGSTNEVFTEEYEYRIDYSAWTACEGKTIPVTASDKTQLLQIRKAATDINVASDTCDIRIKAKAYIEGDFKVKYSVGKYTITSIPQTSNIQIYFSDLETVKEEEWKQSVAYTENTIISPLCSKYAHIRLKATKTEPASLTKTTYIDSTAHVDIQLKSDGGSVSGGGVYTYGEIVTLKATSLTGYRFAGWMIGNKIISTDAEYRFTMTEDIAFAAKFLTDGSKSITAYSDTDNVTIKGTGDYDIEASTVLTAECTDENKKFVCWENNDGGLLSTSSALIINVNSDVQVNAVFADVTDNAA